MPCLFWSTEKLGKGLKRNTNVDEALNVAILNPATHTYGYLFLLHYKAIETEIKDHSTFIEQVHTLMMQGDGS